MAWPPSLQDLKTDQSVEDNRDDTRLQDVLDAAVAFVEGVHAGRYNFAGLVNLNTATSVQLQALPGVDATIAQDIIDGRLYSTVADVEAVVGESVFDGIEALVTVAPAPTSTIELGTIRLAYRWHVRRRSPDALVDMAEMGASRVPSFDPDIERMLKLGRYARAVFA